MADEIKVLKQHEDVEFLDAGKSRAIIVVTYKVGDDGPFVHRFAKEGFTGAGARMELEAAARELRALRG